MNECTEKRETIADIVTELRQSADSAFPYDVDAMNIYNSIADRIEAAHERERESCNAAAMREALENIAGYAETARCHTDDAHVLGYLEQIEKWAKVALSAPPRNCDVGTVEEQKERFDAFCNAQPRERYGCDCNLQKNRQGLCEGLCEFAWAQTPYAAQEGARE